MDEYAGGGGNGTGLLVVVFIFVFEFVDVESCARRGRRSTTRFVVGAVVLVGCGAGVIDVDGVFIRVSFAKPSFSQNCLSSESV